MERQYDSTREDQAVSCVLSVAGLGCRVKKGGKEKRVGGWKEEEEDGVGAMDIA